MIAKNKKPLSKLYELSSRHKGLMDSGLVELAGCFDCQVTFPPGRIGDYIDEYTIDNRVDEHTARCPNCGTDAVIPVRWAEKVLRVMNECYFDSTPVELTDEEAEDLEYLKTLLFGDDDGTPVLKSQKGIVH
jgi:hypothetical protein